MRRVRGGRGVDGACKEAGGVSFAKGSLAKVIPED